MVHIIIILGIMHFWSISWLMVGWFAILQVVVYFTRFYSTSECSGQAISFPNSACNGLFGPLARELRARYFLMFWFHPKEVTLPEFGPPLKKWVPSSQRQLQSNKQIRALFYNRHVCFPPIQEIKRPDVLNTSLLATQKWIISVRDPQKWFWEVWLVRCRV